MMISRLTNAIHLVLSLTTTRFGISLLESECLILFEMIDTDGNGSISFDEFEAWCNLEGELSVMNLGPLRATPSLRTIANETTNHYRQVTKTRKRMWVSNSNSLQRNRVR